METLKGLLAKADIDPTLIEDIVVGNVRNPGASYAIRAAALAAGVPESSPSLVVNRFCSSGLMAIRSVANQIQAGEIDCGLAMGVESMTTVDPAPTGFSPEVEGARQAAQDCKMPMGWTSENVAADFNISREAMDSLAARSHARAAAAQSSGKFDAEIFPITVPVKLPDGTKSYTTVSADDGIRANSTVEGLGKIKPAFPQWAPSQTTGGNASQLTDGAAGVVLMRRSLAKKLGKRILGKYVACAVSGLAPRIMGIGPAIAIPKLLDLTGLSMSDVDIIEINEAFASMAVYCEQKLNLDANKFNVNGGAIALGHPLGAVSLRGELLCDDTGYLRPPSPITSTRPALVWSSLLWPNWNAANSVSPLFQCASERELRGLSRA
jgi:acetyl-CoA acyltransferase 1